MHFFATTKMYRFTSDHGNLAGEHGKKNKGRPYRASAGVPFIIRYPDVVPKGKIIKSALSSIDFAPSILSLMNLKNFDEYNFDGRDFTSELINPNIVSETNHISFSFDTGNTPIWAAAIQKQYKLVVSAVESPWLFDLDLDPYEINNYFDKSTHETVRVELLDALYDTLEEHNIPLKNHTEFMYWSTPTCFDSKDRIEISANEVTSCTSLNQFSKHCDDERIQNLCPNSCGRNSCCKNSLNSPFWLDGELFECRDLRKSCNKQKVQVLCPITCNKQTNCRDSRRRSAPHLL